MKRNLLITGGAGFIGSHFIELVLKEFSDNWNVINLDKLTYASDKSQITHLESYSNYFFIEGDINKEKEIKELFEKTPIHSVIHFAAESHVDNSISNPRLFFETNIIGTQNLLEGARHIWLTENNEIKEAFKDSRFHHISTDEVYGSLSFEEAPFTEKTPYDPSSPYSSSKASSDFIVKSYFRTYNLPVTLTNCSNNYGSRQNDEKLIPTIIRTALEERPLPIYGDGKNIRDWLHVEDHCRAIWEVFTRSSLGETYNVGGNSEYNNLEVVKAICQHLDSMIPRNNGESYISLLSFVKDRPGHDRRYAIDASKIKKDLGWEPKYTFQEGIKETVSWYIKKYRGKNS